MSQPDPKFNPYELIGKETQDRMKKYYDFVLLEPFPILEHFKSIGAIKEKPPKVIDASEVQSA